MIIDPPDRRDHERPGERANYGWPDRGSGRQHKRDQESDDES